MKCINCHEHGLIATMPLEGPLVCDMICWKLEPLVVHIIARGQTPELNAIEAPDWCPLAKETEIK